MRVLIFCQQSRKGYSGGRYYSWLLAEALAYSGHEVSFVTNERPSFLDDFSSSPAHKTISIIRSRSFNLELAENPPEFVFIIPSLSSHPLLYYRALSLSERAGARTIMLNFETPNWFNSLSPVKRRESLWKEVLEVATHVDSILSLTAEGKRFARTFFRHQEQPQTFLFCYPSINSYEADRVEERDKDRQILLFSRFLWADHKGSSSLQKVLCSAMRGHTLVLVVGLGDVPGKRLRELRRRAASFSVDVKVLKGISDAEKFRQLKRSRLVLFPSYFEGFGLPPVEAQYCNVPCIVFDLPVLREVNGDGLIYVEPGNWSQFRHRMGEVLSEPQPSTDLRSAIAPVARLEGFAGRLEELLTNLREAPRFQGKLGHHDRLRYFKRRIFIDLLFGTPVRAARQATAATLRWLLPTILYQSLVNSLTRSPPGDSLK